jgi:hypothetical protein
VAFELSGPNEKAPADEMTKVVARPEQGLGGVGVRQTRISGLVTGVDQAAHTLEVVNPSGGEEHTIFVTDPARIAAMKSVKVGDTITAIVSEALAVSIEPVPAGSDEGQGREGEGQGHGHK